MNTQSSHFTSRRSVLAGMPPHHDMAGRARLSRGRSFAMAAIIAASLMASAAHAAVVTWTGATGGDWNTGTNWSTTPLAPVTADTALFNTSVASVLNAAGVGITSISFDTSAGTSALGTTGTPAYTLGNSGTVGILSSLSGTGKTISINAPIVLTPASTTTAGAYTFANDSASATNTLNFGGPISASTTNSTETLTLSGANTGNNKISGNITNGSATTFAVAKSGAGTWVLSGANTYNGGTTVSAGTLTLNRQTGSLAASGALTMGGGTFNMDNTVATTALTQSLGALTPSAGDSTVKTTRTAAFDQSLTFSSLGTRAAGATLNFVNGGGTNSGTNGFNLTGVTAGYINQGMFYGGSNYAWMDGNGTFVRGIAYATDTNAESISASTAAFTAGKLYEQVTGSGAITAQTTQTINTLNLNNANNFVLASGATLTVNGILKSGNAAGGTISGNTGIKAANNTELVIRTDAAGDTLAISTPILVSGTSSLTKSGAGTLTLSGANGYTGGTTVNAGTLTTTTASGLGTGTATVNTGGTLFVDNSGGAAPITVANAISGSGLVKTKSDTNDAIALNGSLGGFTGTLDILASTTAGTAKVQVGGAVPSSSATVIVENGATLRVNTGYTYYSSLQLAGSGNSEGWGALRIGNNSIWAGSVTLLSDSRIGNPGGTAEISGSIGGSAGLTSWGLANLILSGNNTYTGSTNIQSGILQIGNGGTTGSLSPSSTIDIHNSGSVLTFNRSDAVVQGTNFSNTMFGLGDLAQAGTGTLTLNQSTNSYTGKTHVQTGTLAFSAGNASATANQQLGANATLDLGVASTSSGILKYTGAAGTLAKAINVLGNGTDTIQNSGTGLLTLTGTITKNGTILTLKGGTYGITVSGAGTIAGSNSGSDLIVDGGPVTLATANSYNGPTSIVNGATLNANVTNALPTTNGRSAVSLDQSGTGTSTLALGANQSVASLTGASTSKVTLGANTLTVGTSTGTTTFAGVISGTNGNLIKDSASTLSLSNTNTYTGTTTVNTGTLLLSGGGTIGTGNLVLGGGTFSIASITAGSYALSGSQSLTGAGTILGAAGKTLTVAGTLAPGSSGPGTITLDTVAVTLSGTSTFEFTNTGFTAGSYDLVQGTAGGGTESITFGGTLNLNFSGGTYTDGSSVTIFNLNSYSGGFTVNYSGLGVGQSATFDPTNGLVTVVPEPATWALLAFSLTTVMVLRRRRNS